MPVLLPVPYVPSSGGTAGRSEIRPMGAGNGDVKNATLLPSVELSKDTLPLERKIVYRSKIVILSSLVHFYIIHCCAKRILLEIQNQPPPASHVSIPGIPLHLCLLTVSSQPRICPFTMAELLMGSPLPIFLASSTAYAFITSHQLQCQLLPLLIASWGLAIFVHVVLWLGWIYPRYVSERCHPPMMDGKQVMPHFQLTTEKE